MSSMKLEVEPCLSDKTKGDCQSQDPGQWIEGPSMEVTVAKGIKIRYSKKQPELSARKRRPNFMRDT